VKLKLNKTGESIKKIAICVVLVIVIIIAIFNFTYIKEQFVNFLGWLELNPLLGAFLFMGLYIVATVCFIPGLILTMGSGFAFSQATGNILVGTLIGTVSSWTGASIGAMLAFFISRYVLRDSF